MFNASPYSFPFFAILNQPLSPPLFQAGFLLVEKINKKVVDFIF